MGTMQAPEAYIAELLAALEPLPAVVLPLAEAHGLVLAEDAAAARRGPQRADERRQDSPGLGGVAGQYRRARRRTPGFGRQARQPRGDPRHRPAERRILQLSLIHI